MKLPGIFHRRKIKKLKRSPKLFVPTPSKWQIVIPFKPLSIILILILLGTSVYLFLRSDVFIVKRVSPSTSLGTSGEIGEVLEAETIGRSILVLDVGGVVSKIKEQFLVVKDLKITKRLPDTVEVEVIFREPLAVVEKAVEREGEEEGQIIVETQSFVVDQEGLVYAEARNDEELPRVDLGGQNIRLGDQLSGTAIRTYLDILNLLKEAQIVTDWIRLASERTSLADTIELQIKDGPFVLLSSQKDASSEISSLQTILKHYKIKGAGLKKVDLRFEKPVVEY